MSRREQAALMRRRHIEEMRLAVANGWSLQQAKAEMRRLRLAARDALLGNRSRPARKPISAPAPVERPLQWWQRD